MIEMLLPWILLGQLIVCLAIGVAVFRNAVFVKHWVMHRLKRAAVISTGRKSAAARICVEKPCGSGYLLGPNRSGRA